MPGSISGGSSVVHRRTSVPNRDAASLMESVNSIIGELSASSTRRLQQRLLRPATTSTATPMSASTSTSTDAIGRQLRQLEEALTLKPKPSARVKPRRKSLPISRNTNAALEYMCNQNAEGEGQEETLSFAHLKDGLDIQEESQADTKTGEEEARKKKLGEEVTDIQQLLEDMKADVDALVANSAETNNMKLRVEVQVLQERLKDLRLQLSRVRRERRRKTGGVHQEEAPDCEHKMQQRASVRDPVYDLRIKYENSLLFTRNDVKWPFLYIVAPPLTHVQQKQRQQEEEMRKIIQEEEHARRKRKAVES